MGWTHSDIVAVLALVVAALGFVLSFLSFWRVRQMGEPHAWAQIEATDIRNCYKLTVKMRNPTPYVLKFDSLGVEIQRVPVDDKQDFRLVELKSLSGTTQAEVAASLSRAVPHFKMQVVAEVPSGEIGSVEAILMRGTLSTAAQGDITLYYWSMENKPRYRTQIVRARLPSQGITISLTSV
jgi:hypothetical protein